MKIKERKKDIFGIAVIIILFILVSFLVQQNLSLFRESFDIGIYGQLIFVLILTFATIIAPVSAIPLFPAAVSLWGWKLVAILSILGWTLGAVMVFEISRGFGKPRVKRLVNLKKVEEYERYLPKENIFLTIVLLRMAVPVDFLSYALGLFSNVNRRIYYPATLIGVTPFAIVFAYAGELSLEIQIITLALAIIIFIVGGTIALRRLERNKKKKRGKRK